MHNHPGLCVAWNCTRLVKPGWFLCMFHWLCVPWTLRNNVHQLFDLWEKARER